MGNEIIKVENVDDNKNIKKTKNPFYAKYEHLLIVKDEVKKEAFLSNQAYIREFGDIILKNFKMKIKSIEKKKAIEYILLMKNKGKTVDKDALEDYLLKKMEGYQKQLAQMTMENEDAKGAKALNKYDLLKIKRIYHGLVKKIHPDINPLTNENEDLKDLWQRLIFAYDCNNLKTMEELEVLINSLLKSLDFEMPDADIVDVEKKIEEVEKEIKIIKSNNPYLYKFILENEEKIKKKKEELQKEYYKYKGYVKKLDEMLKSFL